MSTVRVICPFFALLLLVKVDYKVGNVCTVGLLFKYSTGTYVPVNKNRATVENKNLR